ncbi:DNA alkylation repair enzyme [Fimicolochytrium jonesii]|uniref:DNA alkylation repair enzyme n=1 Tax=Fimicolochytrium jonesii TaxID=1396493 RepID=UPI0022FE99C1|nr:DNA alkylation repair enzyme [Fimicolochytrium jonesii]KAI8815955.1 DNA alkylation repair enzyme [Fimicolochytrium jonesii]
MLGHLKATMSPKRSVSHTTLPLRRSKRLKRTESTADSMPAVLQEFRSEGSPQKAKKSAEFFKTGLGQYGEGDRFLGINVPTSRTYATRMKQFSLPLIREHLLQSKYHEERLLGWLAVTEQFKEARKNKDEGQMGRINDLYMANTASVNNWDIVDTTADKILGVYLHDHTAQLAGADGFFATLSRLAVSPVVWERRIAIMATFHFIRMGLIAETLRLAEMLLSDGHDLIHKAVGWMLREAHKREPQAVEDFLEVHARDMPRTMLRYSVEKFAADRRKFLMELR